MAKKMIMKAVIVIGMMILMSVPVFAAEAEVETVTPKAPIAAVWSVEKQTIEVTGIDFAAATYKVQLINADGTTYTCAADQNTHLPVNANGTYTVRVLKQREDTKYNVVYKETVIVEDCNGYLGSSEVVDFEENQQFLQSEAIQQVLSNAEDYQIAQAAFRYLDKNWKYNYDRANTVKSWYVPNTDANDVDKSGICYDYAAAYASIMREAGIQCKVIFGYAQTRTGSVYHAWNEVNLYGKWYIVDACWGEYAYTNYARSTAHVY